MLEDSLRAAVERLPPGWSGTFFERVGSTQDEARAAARRGTPSRSVFVADEQTAGRGRHGRRWLAASGSALLVSIVFRHAQPAPVPWQYTSLVSLALAEGIELVVPHARPAIKWPNDLVLDGRKVAGVLAESSFDGEHLLVVVGAGLNVNAAPDDLADAATSLRAVAGERVDRGELLRTFVGRLDAWLARPVQEAQAAWQRRLWGRGQRLRLVDVGPEQVPRLADVHPEQALRLADLRPEQALSVVVLGVEPNGALRVRLPDGSERRTTTGELLP